MMRSIAHVSFAALLSNAAFGQSASPKFEIADVHVSPKATNAFVRNGPVRNGRYEIRQATMVDLIRIAYGVDNDKILGGPNWLELDRFDVIAKVPPDSTVEMQKQMLQALLEDRWELKTHKETKPLPAYVLTAGKAPKLKEADGSGESGCKMQSASGPPREGEQRLTMMNADGSQTAIAIGPGAMVHFVCRNMTMAAFAAGLRGMLGAQLGANGVSDETGLKGSWSFDVKWSLPLLPFAGDAADRVTVFDALEKQLGLKLEQRQIPTPVLMVDKANRMPSANSPEVAEALPTPPAPKEFEVADVKPTAPDARPGGRFQMQPGGRFIVQGMPLRFLVGRAFPEYSNDQLIGVPGWADAERFDITALAAVGAQQLEPIIDQELLAPMMRALLADRFKMTYHTEERTLTAYSLVAVKPKMKKAAPDSRILCKSAPAPSSAPPRSMALTCQNTTMAQFAERLRNMAPGSLNLPVLDATGLEEGWDFAVTFNPFPQMNGPGRGGDGGPPGGVPLASDPSGDYTIFEVVEKQLGLKLEKQPRSMQVVVIDHIERKPTD